jgi:hypothetical protein
MLPVFVLLACHQLAPNYLDGSLTGSYDLAFDETQARLYSSELSIEYVEDPEGEAKVALRVTLDVTNGQPEGGKIYDLLEHGAIGRSDVYGSPLPDLSDGEIEFTEYGSDKDSKVEGTFSASFATEDDATLQIVGGFKTELEIVDL